MSTFNGHAFITGISTGGQTVQIGGYAACFIDSVPMQHMADLTEHKGASGNVGALQWNNERLEMTITFRPASTASIEAAEAKAIIIPKGATVALSGFKQVKRNGVDVLNGDWINVGDATLTLNVSERADVTLQIRNYLDQQTLLKTQVPAS